MEVIWVPLVLEVRLDALYGVRVSRIGALVAFSGMTMTVCSLTPSRIGIITSRLRKSSCRKHPSSNSALNRQKASRFTDRHKQPSRQIPLLCLFRKKRKPPNGRLTAQRLPVADMYCLLQNSLQ
jgi:hypothetical protein